jgi:hypothetical protein
MEVRVWFLGLRSGWGFSSAFALHCFLNGTSFQGTKICWEAVFMGGCTLCDTGQDQGRDQVGGFHLSSVIFLLNGLHRITLFNNSEKTSKPTLNPLFFLFT